MTTSEPRLDVITTIANDGQLSSLSTLISANDTWRALLEDARNFTLLAPTNDVLAEHPSDFGFEAFQYHMVRGVLDDTVLPLDSAFFLETFLDDDVDFVSQNWGQSTVILCRIRYRDESDSYTLGPKLHAQGANNVIAQARAV
jgi:hypothetical protein